MRRKYLIIGAVVMIVAGVARYGWRSTGVIPADPDEVILFSVDGTKIHENWEERGTPEGQELLHDCPVMGRVGITDAGLRREVVAAVDRDIRTGQSEQAKCFWPRHVLRVAKDGRAVDVVICYQCHNYELHGDDGSRTGLRGIGEESKTFLTKILTDAGVPIAP